MTSERDPESFLSRQLDTACPKCGSPVGIKHWEGRYYTKCSKQGCFFGFDADEKGSPLLPCPACRSGRLKTTPKGRVCADCGKWAKEAAAEPTEKDSPLGECPKCRQGRLEVRKGQFGTFVSCSARCGLTYGSDEAGVPEGGHCAFCKGPVKKTRTGSRICVVCEKWQDEKPGTPSAGGEDRPPKPKDAKCPRCMKAMKVLWTKRKKWAYLCDDCSAWYDA